MAYFRNSTINLLNLHYGIHSLALSGGGAFFVVFLLKSGVPASAALASIAVILLGRLAIRPIVERWHEPDDAKVSSPVVCPVKAGVFSRR
jgi:hypothetical protein